MALYDAFVWLAQTPFSTGIRESDWSFSLIETVHVLGLALMAGTVAVADLRLLGVAFRREPVANLLAQVLPITWTGFAVMAISGVVLFASEAEKLYANPAFWVKLVLLVGAGVNQVIFHKTVYRSVDGWTDSGVPGQAKAAAVASLVLWSAIIVLGRAIAYFPTEVV